MITLLLVLAALPAATGDTVPVEASPAARATAYHDAAAGAMVAGARERRSSSEASIRRYRNLATSRVSVGVSTLRRERLLYRCESAVRVDWHRDQPIRQEILGAREVVPIVSARVTPEDSDCSGAIFDPGDDRLSLGAAGLVRGDSGYVRHPLAVGSETDYRFRSGDVTTLRLADGTVIRLRELQVIPRRSDSRLVSGSLWLEEESMAVVRAILRLARPYDLGRDGDEGDSDVPAMLRPVRGDLRYLTIEYGLWEGRWWLPRLIAVEGEVQMGSLMKLPLRIEQGYTDYEVWGEMDPQIAVGERLAAPPQQCRPGRREEAEGAEEADSASTARGGSITIGTGGASVEVRRPSCVCQNERCWLVERVVPQDTAQLLTSEYLPPSIFQEGDILFTDSERAELRERLRAAAPAPWQLSTPEVRWGWQGLDLLRYNRVEGLSAGVRAEVDVGRARVDATARLGAADRVPNAEVGFTSRSVSTERRLAAFHRLEAVRPGERGLGPGNSLSALLFGRDDGFYYRAAGAELLLAPVRGHSGLRARLFAEHQRAAEKNTDVSVPALWRSEVFGANIAADEATQAGVRVGWVHRRGLDPTGVRTGIDLGAEAATGSFRYLQPSATVQASLPLGARSVAAVELSGATSFGDVPTQRLWYLGGPATVRGYGAGADRGEAFWRARAEVARSAPGARLIVFGDAGRADAPGRLGIDPTLLSAGVGASVLDGLLRLDLGRGLRGGGWRLDLHLDAPL